MKSNHVIAIVGSADPGRTYDPPLVEALSTKAAAEQLGKELAQHDCRIMVYHCSEGYVEGDVVRGYVSHKRAMGKSIIVRYRNGTNAASFPERSDHDDLFDLHPDASDDWEVSFYRSLKQADGFLLVGGGNSTYIAGLIAIADRAPLLAISRFGGAARKVWKALRAERDLPTENEIMLMGQDTWTATMARSCVQGLLAQIERRNKEKVKELEGLEEKRTARREIWGSIISAALCLLTIFVLVIGLSPLVDVNSLPFSILLFFSGALAGTSGASVNSLWRRQDMGLSPGLRALVLGLTAGAISALLFILAQVVANPALLGGAAIEDGNSGNPRNLFAFAVIIGFVAGFTFDKIFERFSQMDALKTQTLGLSAPGLQRTGSEVERK